MKNSIRLRLSLWISGFIVVTGFIAAGLSFVLAFADANEMQDSQLQQIAALASSGRMLSDVTHASADDSEAENRLLIQTLNGPGGREWLSANLRDGIQTVRHKGEGWRVVVRPLPSGERIAVGQPTALRDEIATNSAVRTLVPLLLAIPGLILILVFLIKAILKPVVRLSVHLDARPADDAATLDTASIPQEIAPFVVSINRLLTRVSELLASQQRFIADAAHELRTPVTALLLQAENLERCDMPAEARSRLLPLSGGLARTRALLEQLLSLARQQNAESGAAPIRLDEVVREVLRDVLPLAGAKNLDVAADTLAPVQIRGTFPQLAALVRNALDNAVRYTPAGGRIEISISANAGDAVMWIDDSGPGLPDAELERVFEPFYRASATESGSGLGLAIVRAVAQRLGGDVKLVNLAQAPGGLRLCYTQRLAMPSL